MVTRAGSDLLWSPSGQFVPGDMGCSVIGTNLQPLITIVDICSDEVVQVSAPATGDCDHGGVAIGLPRNLALQAEYRTVTREVAQMYGCVLLDLYDAWAEDVGPGWDAAWRAGLMKDGIHPSQHGHDDIAERVLAVLDQGAS